MEEEVYAGHLMLEIMLMKACGDYNNGKYDWEDFKDPLTAGLSPSRISILKIACENLTDSRKDYHIVMSFIEKLESSCKGHADDVYKEFENNPITLKED